MNDYQAMELVRRCYLCEASGNGHEAHIEDEYRRARERHPIAMSLALARFIRERCGEQYGYTYPI